jgi:hypothetical protein
MLKFVDVVNPMAEPLYPANIIWARKIPNSFSQYDRLILIQRIIRTSYCSGHSKSREYFITMALRGAFEFKPGSRGIPLIIQNLILFSFEIPVHSPLRSSPTMGHIPPRRNSTGSINLNCFVLFLFTLCVMLTLSYFKVFFLIFYFMP